MNGFFWDIGTQQSKQYYKQSKMPAYSQEIVSSVPEQTKNGKKLFTIPITDTNGQPLSYNGRQIVLVSKESGKNLSKEGLNEMRTQMKNRIKYETARERMLKKLEAKKATPSK